MSKWRARSSARVLSLVLVLLVLVSSISSAQPRDATMSVIQVAKLTASDGAEGDYFGRSVSISGNTVVVGAYWDDDSGNRSGSAYLFERDAGGAGNWSEVAKLTASDGAADDKFGVSVSIDDDTVVVGAYGDDGRGAAYLFERPEAGWTDMTEAAKLTASDGAAADLFGASVSISGGTVVVGAYRDDDRGPDSGSVYLFVNPDAGWTDMTETAKLTASDGAEGDNYGISVSISGDTLIVGAFGDADSGFRTGSAYLFEKPEGGWTHMIETAKLTASDGAYYDAFGGSLSISGNTLVVGAYGDDDSGYQSGSAYLFEKPEAGWASMTETAKLSASDGAAGDSFGASVSISGDTLVVGANEDDDNGDMSGSGYLFEKPGSGWADMTQTAKITASDGAIWDWFGTSVSINGPILVASAHRDDDSGADSGSAYIFSRFTPAAWVYLPVVVRSVP